MFSFFSFSFFYNKEKCIPPSWPLYPSGLSAFKCILLYRIFSFYHILSDFSSYLFFSYINVVQYFHNNKKKKKQEGMIWTLLKY